MSFFHKKMSQNVLATIMPFGPVTLIFYCPQKKISGTDLPSTMRRTLSKNIASQKPHQYLPSTMRRTLSKNAASQKPHQYLPSTMRRTLSKNAASQKPHQYLQCLKWMVAQSPNETNILFGRPKAAPN